MSLLMILNDVAKLETSLQFYGIKNVRKITE